MRYSNALVGIALGALMSGNVLAAPTAAEAAELGKSLTPFGAEKAGNKEGTIPAWDGGICTPPAGYKPAKGLEAGGLPYVDPYAADKPLFTITAQNLSQYADKVDEGAKELFRRFPTTYKMNVYPSHRSACYPKWMYDNTIARVMKPKLVGSAPGLQDAHAQVPFPIPKTGYEAMWNTLLKPEPVYTIGDIGSYLVDSSGGITEVAYQIVPNQNNYWDNSRTSIPEDKPYWTLIARVVKPTSTVGVAQMRHMFMRTDQKDPQAWSYIPGQRRVRLAPDFTYDTVSTTSGGILLFDEVNGFDGKMDRFDFKLVGKKEMYLPYNAYAFWDAPVDKLLTPNHSNPDYMRYELHRFWVVEATLKPGERHVQKKKTFYLDEDSWNIVGYVAHDHADKVHHLNYQAPIQAYDKPEIRNSTNLLYDFNKRAYSLANKFVYGFYKTEPFGPNTFTPDALAGTGVR
jgi:hypothetical protein